jgi:hypothetical protein
MREFMPDNTIPSSSCGDEDSLSCNYRSIASDATDLAKEGDQAQSRHLQALFDLCGLGSHLWEREDADDYVMGLREGWDRIGKKII